MARTSVEINADITRYESLLGSVADTLRALRVELAAAEYTPSLPKVDEAKAATDAEIGRFLKEKAESLG